MSPQRGRPKSQNPMNDRIYIRVTKEEKKEIMNFSESNGFSLLELLRIGIEKVKKIKKSNRLSLATHDYSYTQRRFFA